MAYATVEESTKKECNSEFYHPIMKKKSLQGCSELSIQHGKINAVQKQVNLQSAAAERRCQKKALQEYQISLEKDIAKLQKQLKLEVDTHKALERAFTRTRGALPRFSPGLASKVQELVAEVAVLEEEVVHLEECITMLHQGLHIEALHTTAIGQIQKEPSQDLLLFPKEESPTKVGEIQKEPPSQGFLFFPKEESPTKVDESNHLLKGSKDKRNSVIAQLLPPTNENTSEKASLVNVSPTYGEQKQNLGRSYSYRSASLQKNSAYGFCYG